jgi:hypothetical protein
MPIAAPLMLAPFAAMLPLDEAARGWPTIGNGDEPPARSASPSSLVRLLALAMACGGERAVRVVSDPTARRLAGVGEAVSIGEMRTWLGRLEIVHVAQLEQTVGEWRLRSGTIASGPRLLAEVAGEDGSAAASRQVLMDCARGHWIAVSDSKEGRCDSAALQHWLDLLAAAGAARELIALTDNMARLAREMGPGLIVRLGSDLVLGDRGSDPITTTLAGCDRLASELDWLALPASLGVPRPLELALAVIAQGLLRDLAGRLPGFSRASLPHLWVNFLAVGAKVEHAPQRLIARLARPPLAMVMAMTGIMHSTYGLPWLRPEQISLFPAEAA